MEELINVKFEYNLQSIKPTEKEELIQPVKAPASTNQDISNEEESNQSNLPGDRKYKSNNRRD